MPTYQSSIDQIFLDFRWEIQAEMWTVSDGFSRIPLDGYDSVRDSTGQMFLLVRGDGGYTTIQSAVDAAPSKAEILVAPGEYVETKTTEHGAGGLYIDKPLTIWGFSGFNGLPVLSGSAARNDGPTVISGAQNNFGANHWIDAGGDSVRLRGLHLQAGENTTNKLLEIWADNVQLAHNFIDTFVKGDPARPSYASAVYFNEVAGEPIEAFDIVSNILNEGIYIGNAVGNPLAGVSTRQKITNNHFETSGFDYSNPGTLGRYDMVAVQGEIPGVGWQTEGAQVPAISGNTRSDNSAPFLFRMTEADQALFPTLQQLRTLVEANSGAATTYAYVVQTDGGDPAPRLVERDDGDGPYHQLLVANGIDTLNYGLDDTADAVFGSRRVTMEAGDTVVVQSGVGKVDSAIMVDDLTILATADSANLNLTLATEYADGTGIEDGVRTITLADHDDGEGADVDVTGNGLDNVITGNSGDNALSGAGGDDTLAGGAGADSFDGGDGVDTVVFGGPVLLTADEDGDG